MTEMTASPVINRADDRRAKFACLIFLFAVGTFAVAGATARIAQWANIDPYSDQAFQIHWVRQIVGAEAFLPTARKEEGFLTALERGGDNLLYAYASKVVPSNESVFVTAALAWHGGLGAVFGTSLTAQAAIGIATHWIMLAVLALLTLVVTRRLPLEQRLLAGAVSFAVAVGSATLQIVSTVGFHNVGIASLLLAALATQRWLCADGGNRRARRLWAWMIAAQAFALYAYFTNVMFLPLATMLAILLQKGMRRDGLARVGAYALSIAIVLAPAGVLVATCVAFGLGGIAGRSYDAGIALVLTAGSDSVAGILDRMGSWFVHVVALFSIPGLVVGLAGLCVAAIRLRSALPLCLVVAHWLAGAFVPVFDAMYDRTGAYILPILAFGMGVMASDAWGSVRNASPARKGIAVGIAGFLVYHVWIEAPGWIAARKATWSLDDRIERPFLRGAAILDRSAAAGTIVIPANYGVYYYVSVLSQRIGHDVALFRPLDILAAQAREGKLAAYVEKRHLVLPQDAPLLLATVRNADIDALVGPLNSVLADPTFGRRAPVTVSTSYRGLDGGGLVFRAVEHTAR